MGDHFHEEEAFHARDRKISRRERKLAKASDRSKFKLTNRTPKQTTISAPPGSRPGRVLSILGEHIWVDCEGETLSCTLRGKYKKEQTLQKSLIAVGDRVHILEGAICAIEPRKTVLSRADNLRRRKQQIIAANIDKVLITVSCLQPRFTTTLIDRYLIMTSKGNMQPVIVINKCDLLNSDTIAPDELELAKIQIEEAMKTYTALHIPIHLVSVNTGEGLDALKKELPGNTVVLSGQSGVGKSSLINHLLGTNLHTQSIVSNTGKGSHTTTRAHLIPLECGGFCVDTPGIKSFGVWDLTTDELAAYFTEIFQHSAACKFNGCTHTHEPECAVKDAVENETISPARYLSYTTLLEELENPTTLAYRQ